MAMKSYIFTNDFKAPYVTATGLPHNPQKIGFRKFQKGEIVKGELKHANNKPAFVLVHGVCVVPLDVIKELVTREVVSHTDGTVANASQKISETIGLPKDNSNSNVRYLDAMLIGALLGFGGVYLAEKQGWIAEPNKKYKLYGAGAGALLGMYYVYRQKTQKKRVKLNTLTKE